MKNTFLVLLFIGFQINLNYSFDYQLEYEIKDNDLDTIQFVNYYVNSKNNDYYAAIRKNKKSEYQLYFRDQDSLTAQAIINGNYKNLGTITLPDSLTKTFTNIYEYKAKEFKIEKLKDTLINNKSFARVIFKKTNAKNIGSHIYIIDTSKVMRPFFTDPTILNIWRFNRNIPDGLVIEKHVYNSKGKLSWTEKLRTVNPIKFNLLIR